MSTLRFNFPLQDSNQRHRLLYVSYSRYENDWHSLPHTHYCMELFYVLSGNGFFLVESQHFPVREGELVIVNPYVSHTELSFAENSMEYIVLGIEGVRFHMPTGSDQAYFHLVNLPEQKKYSFYMQTIFQEMRDQQENHLSICSLLSECLLLNLQRTLSQLLFSDESSLGKINSECSRIKQYLDDHFTENITLDDLSKLAHLNKHHLVHIFTKEVGCSPISYLLARRLAESKHLLENSNHSVNQISRLLGFSSPSYFSQRFKKIVGMSPLEYRKAVQAQPQSVPAQADVSQDNRSQLYTIPLSFPDKS